MYTYIYAFVYACLRMCIIVCVCAYLQHMRMCIDMYCYIYIHVHMYIYIHIYIFVYIYICPYRCICTCNICIYTYICISEGQCPSALPPPMRHTQYGSQIVVVGASRTQLQIIKQALSYHSPLMPPGCGSPLEVGSPGTRAPWSKDKANLSSPTSAQPAQCRLWLVVCTGLSLLQQQHKHSPHASAQAMANLHKSQAPFALQACMRSKQVSAHAAPKATT